MCCDKKPPIFEIKHFEGGCVRDILTSIVVIHYSCRCLGTRHDYPTRDQVVLTCNVPDHHFLYSLGYDAALIVLCTVYAVKTRKVPENFNETKFIGFSMYTTCVMWLCWILFFFGTGSDFEVMNSFKWAIIF